MTPDTTTEAIRALTQAVEGLRDSIAPQIPWPAWVQAGATAVLVGVTLIYVGHTRRMAKESTTAAKSATESAQAARDLVRLEGEKLALARDRESRQRENDKRLLAGALAAELRGFVALWNEIEPPEKLAEGIIITWGVQQSYSSVFDSSGNRLFLLGKNLLEEVSVSYFKLKRALDNLSVSQRITEYVQTFGRQAGSMHQAAFGKMALRGSEEAVKTGRSAVKKIEELLPKLEAIADSKQAKGQPT